MDDHTQPQVIDPDLITRYKRLDRDLFKAVRHAIYTHRFDAARQLLQDSKADLEKCEIDPGIREALEYELRFVTNHLNWHPQVNDWTEEDFLAGREFFIRPARSPLGDVVRRKHLLTMRMFAERDGFDSLVREDFLQLLTDTPFELSASAWYNTASWGFTHRDLELVSRAFESFLLNPPSVLGQAHWQRVNMMYQLLSGKASKRDVLETIKTLEVQPMYFEFVTELLPLCEEQGLVDDEIRDRLEERRELIETRSEMPAPERRTKSFIKGSRK